MNEDIQLITEIDKRSPIAEAYRSIRTNLQFAGAGKELKYISFTSATPPRREIHHHLQCGYHYGAGREKSPPH